MSSSKSLESSKNIVDEDDEEVEEEEDNDDGASVNYVDVDAKGNKDTDAGGGFSEWPNFLILKAGTEALVTMENSKSSLSTS